MRSQLINKNLNLEGLPGLRGLKRRSAGYFSLLLFLLFIFTPSVASANSTGDPDSTKKEQYDINDPRNPDCPCHQHQKQAEEEYRRMQQQRTPDDNSNNDVRQQDDSSSDDIEQQDDTNDAGETISGSSGDSHHQRKMKTLTKSWQAVKKWKRKLGNKHNGTLKRRFNIAGCYHW